MPELHITFELLCKKQEDHRDGSDCYNIKIVAITMRDVCYNCTFVLSVYMYNQFALPFILPEANSQGRYE